MAQTVQIDRSNTNTAPPPLLPGALSVELGAQTKLWVGSGTGNRLLLSSDPVDTSALPYLKLSGGTLTGPLVLAANPATALGAATKAYVDAGVAGVTAQLGNYMPLGGGTISGNLGVTGAFSAGSISTGSETVSGALSAGSISAGSASISGALSAGSISAGSASISGALSAGSISTGPVTAGATHLTGVLTADLGGFFNYNVVVTSNTPGGGIGIINNQGPVIVFAVGPMPGSNAWVLQHQPVSAYFTWSFNAGAVASIDQFGNFYANSYTPSDRDLKEDIEAVDEALPLVMQLNPVSFKYVNGDGDTHRGLIAQDLAALLPGAVRENLETKHLAVNYTDVLMTVLRAVQELSLKVEAMEGKVV